MFKKYIKFTKVLVAACAFCAINFSVLGAQENAKTETIKELQSQENSNSQKQQMLKKIDEIKQEVLNNFNKYDKKDFQVKGFTNKIYYRKGLPVLVYEHNKTKAKIVFQIFNDEIIKDCQDNYFFRAFEASDRGFVHLCEHCLGDISQMQKFASEMLGSDFGFATDEYGVKVYFSSQGDKKIYEADMLKYLRNPDTIDDKEKFEVEKNRAINEARNKNHLSSLKFDDSKYNLAGLPEQIQTIKHEEFKSFVENYIHPSNLLVTRYISDADPTKIKEYLNLLDKEYLKYFNYKEINVKYFLKNYKVYNKKLKNISEKEQSSNEKFIIKIKFDFDSLNLNVKQRDALSLMFKDDEKCIRYINNLGYVPINIFGILRDDSSDCGYIVLHTNDAELCKEEVIRENTKKIIQFLKDKFKNFTDEQIMKSSNIISNLYQTSDDLFLNLEERVFKYYLNYRYSDSFFDYVQKSFAKHNDIFSQNIFNVNKNNEILEDENSVLKNIKGNIDVFDILAEKGPTQVDVYETVLLKEKDFKKLNKNNDFRSAFFVPIEIKDYGKNRAVFNFISWLFETHLSNLIGYKKGLTYSGMNITGLKDSDFVGYFYENIFAEKDVTDYIYKNFDQIMSDFKFKEEERFKWGKVVYKKRLVSILKKMIKYQIKYEYANNILSFLKSKNISNLSEEFNLSQLKKLIYFTYPYNNIEFLLLKDLKDIEKLKNDENEFNRKYPDNGMKITNEMVKDYKELVFDNYYNLFKYFINFHKDCLKQVDGIKFDDFLKAIESVSLIKKEELEKLNKQLKVAFGFDNK